MTSWSNALLKRLSSICVLLHRSISSRPRQSVFQQSSTGRRAPIMGRSASTRLQWHRISRENVDHQVSVLFDTTNVRDHAVREVEQPLPNSHSRTRVHRLVRRIVPKPDGQHQSRSTTDCFGRHRWAQISTAGRARRSVCIRVHLWQASAALGLQGTPIVASIQFGR